MSSRARFHTKRRPVEKGDSFSVSELHYELPESLIAQAPPPQRDAARMLVVNRGRQSLTDQTIRYLPAQLNTGDLLILNDTRVLPARFRSRRATGGIMGGVFLEEPTPGTWRVMLEGSRRLRESERLMLLGRNGDDNGPTVELIEYWGEGNWIIRVESRETAWELLDRVGQAPLPPYIKRRASQGATSGSADRERYQTVYARVPGAVAAPTAGLHLTDALLDSIRDRGVSVACITLHVGPGTFKPIATEDLADHVMHKEWFELNRGAATAINECRARGGRVVAVGTTSLRVLESAACLSGSEAGTKGGLLLDMESGTAIVLPCAGWTDLFVYPPYQFRVVDALLTNFHLPRSTLLALVMAFAGIDLTRHAYEHAVREAYRFFSYGDAMLIA